MYLVWLPVDITGNGRLLKDADDKFAKTVYFRRKRDAQKAATELEGSIVPAYKSIGEKDYVVV